MELIKQQAILEVGPERHAAARAVEDIGRTCYKSEAKKTPDSAAAFIKRIIKSGHLSVIEHLCATVRFITNRSVTHEMVRHRIAAYSQESTRYVNYGGGPMQFILPVWVNDVHLGQWNLEKVIKFNHRQKTPQEEAEYLFVAACLDDERSYGWLLQAGWKPEQAREVLGNALKTEICTTYNFRQWRHVLKQRTAKAAHPQIRHLMRLAGNQLLTAYPEFFEDLPDHCFWVKQ